MNIIQNNHAQVGERKFIKIESKSYKNQRFDFQSYELAFAVRQTVYMKIIEFDANNDQQFQENQIREFLSSVLHQSQNQIKYVVRNVFRYDYNNDGVIEYDQLVNFCMEQHFGELAIQRLHKKKLYKKGPQRLMSESQFYQTIKYALSFVGFKPNASDLKIAFETIDNDKDKEISYEDYFRFLKEYFGTKSYAASLVNKRSIFQEIRNAKQGTGQLNILKKYSKYQQGGNNTHNANNIPSTNQPSIKIAPPIANQKFTSNQSNISINSNLAEKNANNKKNAKIEITINQKNKESKTQLILNPAQQKVAIKIAKLVYTQLIATLTSFDSDKDLMLSSQDILVYMKANFNYGNSIEPEIYRRHNLLKNKLISYAQAAKIVINQQISRIFRNQCYENVKKNLDLEQFCQLMEKVCSIVKNTPIVSKYQSFYSLRIEKGTLNYGEVQLLVSFIFNSYLQKK